MFVWFPAAWMHLVVEAIRAKSVRQLGSGELAITRQREKEYVANADDHAYCW